MIKPSPLGGEVILRTEMRIIEKDYYTIKGMREWDVYKQHLPASITALFDAIDAALQRYKARRIERGFYYLRPMADSVSFWIRCPLKKAPPGASRRKALENRRLLLEKRKAVAANVVLSKATDEGHLVQMTAKSMSLMRLCTMWYFAYLVFVLVSCC
ncbi:unnamed protein product [Urochloa decumbens]|uniref:Uncharacterized protein n=1 Tax=Urochloa decumbens TaxID=240449 RepID=A0ABC8ZGG6_9POAL